MGLILIFLCLGFIGIFIMKKTTDSYNDLDMIGFICSITGFIIALALSIAVIIGYIKAPTRKIVLNEQYNQINYEFDQCVQEGVTDELNKVIVAQDISKWNSDFKKYEYWRNNFWTNLLYPDVYVGLGMFEYPIGYRE